MHMGALAKPHLSVSSTEKAREVHQVQPSLHHRIFLRVPTHAISVAEDRRRSPRACLSLPLQLTRVQGQSEMVPVTLVTKNISSSGIYFLAPRHIEPGTAIELQVSLIERPLGRGSVRLKTAAHVVRIEACDVPGWSGFAASFDDIDFDRDDLLPSFSGFH
ncbi:MAG: PilZ domain-containing protein [Candidatus Acidiferrales bacterium]